MECIVMLKQFRLSPVAFLLHTSLCTTVMASTDTPKPGNEYSRVKFNTDFFSKNSLEKIDLTRFENGLPPIGNFNSELIVNGSSRGFSKVEIKDKPETESVDIYIEKGAFLSLGINTDKLFQDYPELAITFKAKNDKIILNDIMPEGSIYFNSGSQSLEISLPQKYIITRPRGYVSPEIWDAGITAGILGYNVNATRTINRGNVSESLYGNINSGLNVSGWMLRHNGVFDKNSDRKGANYTSLNTYVQRDIAAIGSRLILGESNTKGELFDSLPFRGVQLANEEQMLPDVMRGYAPVVRGVARTTSRVIISQSGRKIYEQSVPPGEFEIVDLAPTGYGGDLDVTVEESDGNNQYFRVPYASLSDLLRPGTQHFSMTLGEYNSENLSSRPVLAEITYRRGLSNLLTAYGGIQGNTDYQAYQAGMAIGSKLGAFSFDMTHAETDVNENIHLSGQSYQAKYSHRITQTGSNFSLSAYRFSTDSFMDYQTAMYARENFFSNNQRTAKSRISLSANQSLASGYGQFWVSAYKQEYWKGSESDIQYQFGYSNYFKRANYSFSMNRSRNSYGKNQDQFTFRINIPIGDAIPGIDMIGASLRSGPENALTQQVSVSGSAGDDKQYTYGFSGSQSNQGRGSNMSANLTTRTPYTTVGMIGGTGKNYNTYSISLSGAMVAHQQGITLSPYNADTYALVEADGAQGARINSYSGIRVDSKGYALVPYLSAYRMNEIEINPRGTDSNVEFDFTSQKVAPYSGAVVKLKYGTKKGVPLLITLKDKKNSNLPFGSSIYDNKGDVVGMIGQGGKANIRVSESDGYLTVKWGEGTEQSCKFSYILPDTSNNTESSFIRLTSLCQ